jgi:formylglycine-generating enzyme required for sulfatase activity
MAGNVWEWTRSLWGTGWSEPDFGYPYDSEDGREDLEAGNGVPRVVRGGAFPYTELDVRCAYRSNGSLPFIRYWLYGFRVVVSRA